MKKRTLIWTMGLVIAAAIYFVSGAGATDNPALRGQVVGCPEGYICVTAEEYELHWDVCPIDPNFTPTVTDTPNGGPTPTPENTPTATPPVDEKEKCNRGIGNLEEGCDPGNSFGQGEGGGRPAGEDRHEAEGPPGNQHGSDNGNHKGGGKK